MKAKKLTFTTAAAIIFACCATPAFVSCGGNAKDSQEKAQKTEVADESGVDSALEAMIKTDAPEFKVMEYKDTKTGKTMKYNMYSPKTADTSAKYPLVLFIGDASTAGKDASAPLSQYGALVWATEQSQAQNPCYVLVPQFSQVAVNDEYKTTDEADIVIRLVNSLVADHNIDSNRLYSTGQSMGGMLSMYYDVAYPDMFAASIFVDSHWDKASFDSLVKHKFIYFIAGNEGKAYPCLEPLEEAARKEGVQYTFSSWDAQLPVERQSELAATMLEKGAPVNIFEFEPKTVLTDGKGNEHMSSFRYAYQIPSVRDWLFKQSK